MVHEEIRKFLESLANRFNDPIVQKSISGITKTVAFHIEDIGLKYYFVVENGKLKEHGPLTGVNPDITIITSSKTLLKLAKGETDPAKEFMLGRIKIKGSLRDLLKFKKILEK